MNEDIKTLTDRQLLAEIEYYQNNAYNRFSAALNCYRWKSKQETLRAIEDSNLSMRRLLALKEAAEIRNLKF